MMSPTAMSRRAFLKGAVLGATVLSIYPGARLVEAQGEAEYDLIDLGAFDVEVVSGPETGFGSLNGINELGETCGAVGASESRFSPAIWSVSGRRRRLRSGQPGGGANAINDAGEVAGFEYIDELFRPTVWRDREPVRLPDLDGDVQNARGVAAAINNQGVIVGQVLSRNRAQAVRWVDDVAEMLPDAPTGFAQRAFDINDSGAVVASVFVPGTGAGETAGIWRGDDSVTPIAWAPVPATAGTRMNMVPRAINDRDRALFQITPASTGSPINPAHYYFFVDDGSGATIFHENDGIARFATDLNDDGLIAGSIETLREPPRAVLWRGEEMIELQSVAPTASSLRLTRAVGINNAGMIAAVGRDDAAGLTHGVLLIPAV